MPFSTEPIALPRPANLTTLKPVTKVDLENATTERKLTLKRLLDEGHAALAPLRHPNLQFHSHLPHLLGSAYRLGASSEQLKECYDAETSNLVRNEDESFARGDRIEVNTWRDFINQKPFAVAYVNFFDTEVHKGNGGWKKVLERYLYEEPDPLINGMTGVGHPFIHLAYAYEFEHAGVATEALSLACTELDPYRKIINSPPPDTSTYKTPSLLEVVRNLQHDARLDGICDQPGFANCYVLLEKGLEVLTEHWWAWHVENPLEALEQICDLSVLLAIGSGDRISGFDFFLIHLMTEAHALRVIWTELPEKRQTTILKEYALFTLVIYTAQLRRSFNMAQIEDVDLRGRDWAWVVDAAMNHRAALDSHFFKVVSAPKVFAETFGEKSDFYLKAEVKFLDEYRGWVGFGQGTDGVDPAESSRLE